MLPYFFKVLGYAKTQWKLIGLSILCAVMVAGLYSLNIGAVLPFLKVMMAEEGLHDWVNGAVVKDRCGIEFESVSPLKELGGDPNNMQPVPLRIKKLEVSSPAWEADLQFYDIIQSIAEAPDLTARSDMLAYLAQVEGEPRVHLTVLRESILVEGIELPLGKQPFYANAAFGLLRFVPHKMDKDFKSRSILVIIGFIFAATVFRCLFRFWQEYLVRRVSQHCAMALRRDTFRNAIRLPLNFYGSEGTSDMISRFVQDTNKINRGLILVMGKTVVEPLKIIALLFCAFRIDAKMTLYMLLGMPVAAVFIVLLGRKIKKASRRELESWSRVLGRLKESLLGIRVVKAYHQEELEEKQFDVYGVRLLRHQNKIAKWDAASGPTLEVLGTLAACACMAIAATLLQSNGITASEFTMLLILLAASAESGRKLGDIPAKLHVAEAAAERVYEVINTPSEADPPEAVELPRMSRSIEFREVTFTYPKGPQPVLRDIRFTVQAGQRVAVVGPNGSGKTTLLSLIPRFFAPDSGTILIDDHDISTATLASLRRQIGIVTQQTIVFNDTVRANIAYSDPDANPETVEAAARQAYAHEFITQTEDGYDTVIGEQGTRLSGGQLQRLAIARAILRDPAVLIFDEATSQIDSDSEAKIQKALATFTQGRTAFIIAHRLSTIVDADVILVLDEGQLIGQGRHDELLVQCPLYKQLCEKQFFEV